MTQEVGGVVVTAVGSVCLGRFACESRVALTLLGGRIFARPLTEVIAHSSESQAVVFALAVHT